MLIVLAGLYSTELLLAIRGLAVLLSVWVVTFRSDHGDSPLRGDESLE